MAAAAIKDGLSEIGVVSGASLAYTRCSVAGKGLRTLDGLQAYPHLRSLDASSNELTVTGLVRVTVLVGPRPATTGSSGCV